MKEKKGSKKGWMAHWLISVVVEKVGLDLMDDFNLNLNFNVSFNDLDFQKTSNVFLGDQKAIFALHLLLLFPEHPLLDSPRSYPSIIELAFLKGAGQVIF